MCECIEQSHRQSKDLQQIVEIFQAHVLEGVAAERKDRNKNQGLRKGEKDDEASNEGTVGKAISQFIFTNNEVKVENHRDSKNYRIEKCKQNAPLGVKSHTMGSKCENQNKAIRSQPKGHG